MKRAANRDHARTTRPAADARCAVPRGSSDTVLVLQKRITGTQAQLELL